MFIQPEQVFIQPVFIIQQSTDVLVVHWHQPILIPAFLPATGLLANTMTYVVLKVHL